MATMFLTKFKKKSISHFPKMSNVPSAVIHVCWLECWIELRNTAYNVSNVTNSVKDN